MEAWLQELCGKPGVCDSAEVLEFLGYGCEVAVEYVKKPAPVVVGANRLDKVNFRCCDLFSKSNFNLNSGEILKASSVISEMFSVINFFFPKTILMKEFF